MNGLLKWQFDNKATEEETAVHFLTDNKTVWSSWLNEAAKANLAALLKYEGSQRPYRVDTGGAVLGAAAATGQ